MEIYITYLCNLIQHCKDCYIKYFHNYLHILLNVILFFIYT
jgi:hypothetical protein